MLEPIRSPLRLLARSTWHEVRYVTEALRQETVGGTLLLLAAAIAVVWSNSPWHSAYGTLRDTTVGPASLHLDLSLGTWAADGLLAIFFLVAGIELKREFIAGDLSDPRRAALPVSAAVCGVALPAIFYVAVVKVAGADAVTGWAIPTATDIAFALAVLAVIGSHLPSALRSFLLTLAVVDDLIAITIIAIFYSGDLHLGYLAAAIIPLAVWMLFLRRGWTHPLLLALPALATWLLVHSSGVHATVAGVLLGLTVPVVRHEEEDDDTESLAERIEHKLRPLSAGFAVPVFAFFAAGVRVADGGLGAAFTDPVTLAIILGLVAGKLIGVFGGSWLVAKLTHAELDEDLSWLDVAGVALLSGIGFTVSLLVAELAFGPGSPLDDHAKVGVLTGSLLSALLAAVVLRRRNAHYREVERRENADADHDGIPDVYRER